MSTRFLLALFLFLSAAGSYGSDFDRHFVDRTLRVDYIFSGDASEQAITLDGVSSLPLWAGRRHNMDSVPLKGNGTVTMRDAETDSLLYAVSFSSLFQEWLESDEAASTPRSMENVFLLPCPKRPVNITAVLRNSRQDTAATMTCRLDPSDILIRHKGDSAVVPYSYIHQGGDPSECIDVAIVAEGYTAGEMPEFLRDAGVAVESILSHEPFRSMEGRFNFVAVCSPSSDSGVSVPRLGEWKDTAVSSHFSTFYSDRYLTTSRLFRLHDLLAGIPYEHIIILANTDEYGGGGIYNSYTLTTAGHEKFRPVVVHEFGHSFGGLADEYFYEDDPLVTNVYPTDIEPWEPNITTLVDFGSKWASLIPEGTPVPTPRSESDKYPTGVFEGGGYCTYGVYSPADDCRMRTNNCQSFCAACIEALKRIILFYTEPFNIVFLSKH